MPSTVLSGLSPSRNQVHGNCTRISARDRFGFLSAPNRSPKSAGRRTTKGRSSCSPARSASSRAGGTAATSPATTLSPACRTKRSYGSTGSGAARADGICMEFSPEAVYSPLPAYAELHCLSNFTFLRGASHPEELVRRAAGLGYSALAVTDECSLAGVVRAHVAAAGDVHMHVRSRRPLQDTLTAIRMRTTVQACGHALHPNAERHLRLRMRLAQIYPAELLAETVRIAERCHFSLEELRYEYPEELVPEGETPASHLRKLTEKGLAWRFPNGIPDGVRKLIEHELALIAELEYEPFFLTVYDVVELARAKKILCQGRGSAANSAVCYSLGITEIDPARMNGLFERFVSKERREPPDIDVDFEHERREEVIQYDYGKYV